MVTANRVSITSRRRSRIRVILGRLALILFGIAVSWLLTEIFMRVGFDLLPPNVQGEIQLVRRVPWSDEQIIRPIPFVIEKDFQTRLSPGLRDYPVHWSDAKFTFNTISVWDGHRAGLRTDAPQWPLDMIAFGDSFTFCWTKVDDCWVQRLENDNHWNVVNAGIPATGSLGQLNLMKEIVAPLKPSLVVWAWYNNDVTDDYDLAHLRGETPELPDAPYPDPVREPVGLARYSAVYLLLYNWLYPPPKSTPYRHTQAVILNGRTMFVHTNEYTFPANTFWPRAAYGWTRNVQAHDDAARLLDGLGVKMLVVLIPAKEEAYADLLLNNLGQKYLDQIGETRRMLLAACAERGWHCIDTLPAMKAAVNQGQTVFYAFDSHLDASGNKIVEKLVHDYIESNGLLPGK